MIRGGSRFARPITRYTLSMRIVLVTAFFNNVVLTTVIEMVEIIEILDGRLGKRSVERVRYVINNLLHLVIVKYGIISRVLCISTHLRLVTILSLLVKYLVILHADPCNKSYVIVIPWFEGLSLITVRAKPEGEGSYRSIIPMLPWYNYFIP